MSPPWMPLYIADYRADTAHLSAAEHGAYLNLIMHYWSTGGLPDEDRQLARIACMTNAEWRRAKPVVQAFFRDGWKHGRIDRELARTVEVSASYSARASKAARKRWSKDAPNNASSMLENAEPQPHPQKKEEDAADAATPSALGDERYAFQEGVIRLTEKDFSKWKEAFERLDLAAELIALAPWAADQPHWFHAVSGALAKKNREIRARMDAVKNGPKRPEGYIEGII